MTTVFFSHLTQPQYDAWQANGAPTYIAKPDYPQFSTRINYRDGYAIIETWQRSYVSIEGRDFEGQTLRGAGVVKLTKKGELGAKRFSLSDINRWVLNQAHEAWIAAGKPAEFTYIQ